MQHRNGLGGLLRIDHHRDLDLRSRNHLNRDPQIGQHAKNLVRDSGVGPHAESHHRNFRDIPRHFDLPRPQTFGDTLHFLHRFFQILFGHGEGQIGGAV